MTAAERLDRTKALLDQAVEELVAAEPTVPPYAIEAFTFIRAEVRVCARRLSNAAKVPGCATGRTES